MLSFERARRERSPAQQRHVRLVLEGLKADGWTNIGGGSHDRFVNESQPGEHGRCSPPPRNVARRGAIDRQGGWLDMSQRSGALIYYAGVLDGAGSVWGVRVPDIPGCVGGGATAEAANADVAEALRDVAAHKRDGGFDIPRASTLTEIVASGEIGEGESAVMIPLLIDSGRTVRANVSFDAALLDAIDAAAKERGLTRSAFLASAARGKIMAGA